MTHNSRSSHHGVSNNNVSGSNNIIVFNTLRPRQDGRHFPDDIFKCIFLYENVLISIKISLKFVPKSPIDNIPALVQIMAWRRPGDKQLSEPMMVSFPTHICVTRPQWVNKATVVACIMIPISVTTWASLNYNLRYTNVKSKHSNVTYELSLSLWEINYSMDQCKKDVTPVR